MTFDEILTQVAELLQRQGRVSYGALKRRFALADDYLQDLKDELITAQRVAADEDGKVLVWVGVSPVSGSTFQVPQRATSNQKRETFLLFLRTQPSGLNTSFPQTLDSKGNVGS
jgi:hypothetical protein